MKRTALGLLVVWVTGSHRGRRSIYAIFLAVLALSVANASRAAQQGSSSVSAQEDEGDWGPLKRQEWFYHQRAYPLTHIPPGVRLRAQNEVLKMRQEEEKAAALAVPQPDVTITSSAWTLVGPQPTSTPFWGLVSGRVTAIAVDPTDSTGNTVYIGGAQGGVWKTTDGGTTWTPLTDNQFSLSIGSLAIDPNNQLNVYAGTGEPFAPSSSGGYGGGLLKSSDGGATWTQLGATYFQGAFGKDFGGSHIDALAIQPGAAASTPVLLVGSEFGGGTQYYYYSGIWRSTDGGMTWSHVFPMPFDAGAAGVSIFFVSNSTVYAAIGSVRGNFYNGVYMSTDAGQTWTAANGSGSTAIITGTSAGRITLVAAPSSPSTLYVSIQNPTTLGLAGMFKSTDGGTTWHTITTPLGTGGGGSTVDFCSSQCWFDMALAVSPVDSNLIYAGGSNNSIPNAQGPVYMSTDGGITWSPVLPSIVHTDVHAFSFSASGAEMYVGSDGGIWSTKNVGAANVTWVNLNNALALTQFYPTFALTGSTPNLALIGTQDNGAQIYSGSLTWTYADCGDAFSTAINPANNNVMWVMCGGRSLDKSLDGGSTWARADNGINYDAPGPPPLTMDYQSPNTLYVGTAEIWRTTDGAATPWTSISGGLVGGSAGDLITTIAVSPVSSSTVFVGTSNSLVWFTTNTGGIWTQIPSGLPPRYVTMVQGDPQASGTFYVTFSGFSGFATGDSLGHVFSCTTASATCTDISSNLPNIPANDIVIDPLTSNTLYVGTDLGVFRSMNAGVSWSTFSNGLPNVAVLGLRMHTPTRTLLAATYGRSAWEIVAPAGAGTQTTTALTVVPQSLRQGSAGPVALTATVAPASGSGTPIGSVTFFNGAVQIGTANLTNGTAALSYNPSGLAGGTYSITATYGGDATFAISTSPAQILTIQVPVVTLSSANLKLSSQLVSTAGAPQNVTLTNTGTATLNITSIAVGGANSGDFSETNPCGATLAAAANCSISVTFKPTATGNRAGNVTITDDAAGSPHTVTLTGTGTDFSIDAASGGSLTATVTRPQTATYNLQVTPISGFNGTVSLTCGGAPSEATCTLVPTPVMPNGSSPVAFTATVTTTAPSLMWPRTGPRSLPPINIVPLILAALLALFLCGWQRRFRTASPHHKLGFAYVMILMVLLSITVSFGGCGGGGGGGNNVIHDPGTPKGQYTLNVTGTSSGVNRQLQLTLNVN